MGNRLIFLYLYVALLRLEDNNELVRAGYGMSVQAFRWPEWQIRRVKLGCEYEPRLRPREVWRNMLSGKAF